MIRNTYLTISAFAGGGEHCIRGNGGVGGEGVGEVDPGPVVMIDDETEVVMTGGTTGGEVEVSVGLVIDDSAGLVTEVTSGSVICVSPGSIPDVSVGRATPVESWPAIRGSSNRQMIEPEIFMMISILSSRVTAFGVACDCACLREQVCIDSVSTL